MSGLLPTTVVMAAKLCLRPTLLTPEKPCVFTVDIFKVFLCVHNTHMFQAINYSNSCCFFSKLLSVNLLRFSASGAHLNLTGNLKINDGRERSLQYADRAVCGREQIQSLHFLQKEIIKISA